MLSENGIGTGFVEGIECASYLGRHKEETEAHWDKLDMVSQRFGRFSPYMLELYATTHFIAAARHEIYGKESD